MSLADLITTLRNAGIPDVLYVTDGGLGGGECYGIEHANQGWMIYYSERGRKTPLSLHPDETAACQAMLALVMRAAGKA